MIPLILIFVSIELQNRFKDKLKPDQFVKNEKIYVCYEESNEMQEIKLKKSTVLALIDNENKEEVKAFVEKNRLRYKDVEDVHKILNHYNSL